MSKNNNICVISLQSYDRNFVYGRYNNFEQNHPLFFLREFKKIVTSDAYLLVDKKEVELLPDLKRLEVIDLRKHKQGDVLLNKINRFFSRALFLNPKVLVDFLYPQRWNFFKRVKKYIDKCGILYISAEPLLIPILYAKLKGKKVIYQSYGMYYELVSSTLRDSKNLFAKCGWFIFSLFIYAMEKIVYSLCDTILTISEQDRLFLRERFYINQDKIYVYPFIFDANQFMLLSDTESLKFRKELDFGEKEAVISYAAFHLDSNQNYNVIKFLRQEVVDFLEKKNIQFRFLILGRKSSDHLLQDDKHFLFPGYFHDTKELARYMGIADICISPVTVRNGVKSKTITYMGYKKAVLCTPEGTNGLKVADGKEVLISPLGEFAENLIRLIDSPSLRQRLGDQARNYVEKNFSYDAVFSNFSSDLKKWSLISGN